MDFIFQWFWYLLAFVAGSLVTWLATLLLIKPRSEEEAVAAMPAGARPIEGKK